MVVEKASPIRRFTFSLAEMALLTGVMVRVYRMLVLTHGSNEWWYIGGTFVAGLVLLLGMLCWCTWRELPPDAVRWWRSLAFAGPGDPW